MLQLAIAEPGQVDIEFANAKGTGPRQPYSLQALHVFDTPGFIIVFDTWRTSHRVAVGDRDLGGELWRRCQKQASPPPPAVTVAEPIKRARF